MPHLHKELDKTLSDFEKRLKGNPRDVDALLHRAGILLRKKQFKEARKAYQELLAIEKRHPFGYIGLGYILLIDGKFDEAEKHFRRSLELDPQNSEAHVALGWMYYDHGDRRRAQKAFSKAIEIAPKTDGAHEGLGFVYYDSGDSDQALSEFKTTIAINPQNAGAYVGIGNILANRRTFAEAEEAYHAALSISEFDDSAYFGLAHIREHHSDMKEALVLLQKGIDVNPKIPWGYISKARIQEKLGRYTTAIASLRLAQRVLFDGPVKTEVGRDISRIRDLKKRGVKPSLNLLNQVGSLSWRKSVKRGLQENLDALVQRKAKITEVDWIQSMEGFFFTERKARVGSLAPPKTKTAQKQRFERLFPEFRWLTPWLKKRMKEDLTPAKARLATQFLWSK